MSIRVLLACFGLLVVSGCLYHAREHTDATVGQLVNHPYDQAPPEAAPATPPKAPAATGTKPYESGVAPPTDIETTAYMAETSLAPTDKPKVEPKVPAEIPGSEAPRSSFRKTQRPGSAPSRNSFLSFPRCRRIRRRPRARKGVPTR